MTQKTNPTPEEAWPIAKALCYRVGKELAHPLFDREGIAALAVMEACEDYDPDRSSVTFASFLSYVMWRRMIDEMRKLTKYGKEQRYRVGIRFGMGTDETDWPEKQDHTRLIQQRFDIGLLFERLDGEEATLLYQKYVEGRSIREMAEERGIDKGRFSSYFYRILAKARKEAEDLGLKAGLE